MFFSPLQMEISLCSPDQWAETKYQLILSLEMART